jgi:primary-amine oxidase
VKYFDGVIVGPNGTAEETRKFICHHEQDRGIGLKHTNWRINRAVVTRRRELVIQFIITLAKYEYAFNSIFDQAAGINIQVRATGQRVAEVVDIIGNTKQHSRYCLESHYASCFKGGKAGNVDRK